MQLFEPAHWDGQGAIAGRAVGRGHVLMLDTEFGPAVLKQYLRGGWAAKVSHDRYVFSGFERSRPLMEFRLLERLTAAGLPVPEPLAAVCVRGGKLYSGWLLTRRITGAETLADLITLHRADAATWQAVGSCLRRFHNFGLVHADLNARNILIGGDNRVHLVDLDRSRIRERDARACRSNLDRLHRSLLKLWPDKHEAGLEDCWTLLLEGYAAERKAS